MVYILYRIIIKSGWAVYHTVLLVHCLCLFNQTDCINGQHGQWMQFFVGNYVMPDKPEKFFTKQCIQLCGQESLFQALKGAPNDRK